MAKPKNDETPGAAIAVRGINYAAPGKDEIRVEPGAPLPDTIPADVVETLITEGSARR